MPNINWDNLAEENNHGYKDYAADGKYTVKCTGVEIKEVGTNGSVVQKFQFEETDVKFPTADHWLTFKEGKSGWRQWHNKNLMVLLGASEENAKKAVEVCENKDNKDSIVRAYEQTYKKLLSKKPEVEIEVFTDGKYARADFTSSSVRMNRPDDEKKADAGDDIIPDAEDVSDDLSEADIPF